jgi:hypothetical protein
MIHILRCQFTFGPITRKHQSLLAFNRKKTSVSFVQPKIDFFQTLKAKLSYRSLRKKLSLYRYDKIIERARVDRGNAKKHKLQSEIR